MDAESKVYRGSCHCGAVEFQLKSNLAQTFRCNCSLCRRKGAVMTIVNPEDFALLKGEEVLALYQFNTGAAKHYFCKVCGIYTFHRPRTNPSVFRVNVGCLEGVDPLSLKYQLNDGASLSTVAA
jgi:hypothetical protein